MSRWIDPRTNPAPPYAGPERALAKEQAELTGLIAACKEGRIYDVEEWIASGNPLQLAPGYDRRTHRPATALRVAMAAGSFDLVRLLLCNGYRLALESESLLNHALDARRWDVVRLLLDWGADPASADVWRILGTYERDIFELFQTAGIDLTSGDVMARELAESSGNRPLYGYAKVNRDKDPRIQRALDLALVLSIKEGKERAIALCFWAGANPRRRVDDWGDGDDESGTTALEEAVYRDAPQYLKKFGFNPERDEVKPLYENVRSLATLRTLVAIQPPADWESITRRFLHDLAWELHWTEQFGYGFRRRTSIEDVEGVFALGGRVGAVDRSLKSDLRRLLQFLRESDAQRLFQVLSNPKHMDRTAFIDLIAHEKLAARYETWRGRSGLNRELLGELATLRGIPGPVKRMAKERLTPPPRPVSAQTYLEDAGVGRVFSREELYDLVWSEPLFTLCKRFGLSDNGLRKRCKAMKVPTPPAGYWQRVQHGHRMERSLLPPLDASRQSRTEAQRTARPRMTRPRSSARANPRPPS